MKNQAKNHFSLGKKISPTIPRTDPLWFHQQNGFSEWRCCWFSLHGLLSYFCSHLILPLICIANGFDFRKKLCLGSQVLDLFNSIFNHFLILWPVRMQNLLTCFAAGSTFLVFSAPILLITFLATAYIALHGEEEIHGYANCLWKFLFDDNHTRVLFLN